MKTVLLAVSILFFMSCENLDMKKPSNLISEDQMVEILYDVVLINSAKGVNKQLLEKNIKNPQAYVYKKHNIDSLQFAESNAYYTFKSDTYKSIYEKLELKLTTQKTEYEALLEEKKRVKDSIRKSKQTKIDTLSSERQMKFESKLRPPSKKLDKLPKRPLK
tara:strand:+ start:775 stop:1260 length:486 start_codon:yes stop_codon:yes gene_type:complete